MKIVNVQVDLICRNPQGILSLIEVKMQGGSGLARISMAQRARLSRVATFLAEWEPVEVHLALVQGTKMTLLPVH